MAKKMRCRDEEILKKILRHNLDDILGMKMIDRKLREIVIGS
jgi:hypothetical protein